MTQCSHCICSTVYRRQAEHLKTLHRAKRPLSRFCPQVGQAKKCYRSQLWGTHDSIGCPCKLNLTKVSSAAAVVDAMCEVVSAVGHPINNSDRGSCDLNFLSPSPFVHKTRPSSHDLPHRVVARIKRNNG